MPRWVQLVLADQQGDFPLVRDLGKLLMIFGGLILLIGVGLWTGLAPRWLGRLPGDVRIERDNFGLYFPIVTCVVISILLTLILAIFRR